MNSFIKKILEPGTLASNIVTLILGISIILLYKYGCFKVMFIFLNQPKYTILFGDFSFTLYDVVRVVIRIAIMSWIGRIIYILTIRRINRFDNISMNAKILIIQGIRGVFILFTSLVISDMLKIDLTALALFGGALSIGIGFGMKKIISNVISGYIVLLEKTVRVDDIIEYKDGVMAIVEDISARYTLLRTLAGSHIILPNEFFLSNEIVNWTHENWMVRIKLKVIISASESAIKVQEIISKVLREHPVCSKKKNTKCCLSSIEMGLTFKLYFWIDDIRFGIKNARHDVLMSVLAELEKNNIKLNEKYYFSSCL